MHSGTGFVFLEGLQLICFCQLRHGLDEYVQGCQNEVEFQEAKYSKVYYNILHELKRFEQSASRGHVLQQIVDRITDAGRYFLFAYEHVWYTSTHGFYARFAELFLALVQIIAQLASSFRALIRTTKMSKPMRGGPRAVALARPSPAGAAVNDDKSVKSAPLDAASACISFLVPSIYA